MAAYTIRLFSCAEQIARLGFNNDPAWVRPDQKNGRVTIAAIQAAVSECFGLPLAEMTSDRRAREVARPRQVAMYLSKSLTAKSLPEIGRRFGNRDHTTVMHAVKQIERLQSEDPDFAHRISTLSDKIAHRPLPVSIWREPETSAVPEPTARAWCSQCDRNVHPADADRCSSRWCKFKSGAFLEAAR